MALSRHTTTPGVFRSFLLCLFVFLPSLSPARFALGGQSVVPSKDYSHAPPECAGLRRVKSDGPKTHSRHKKKDHENQITKQN